MVADVSASTIPTRTIAPPISCETASVSSSQNQATTEAATGSNIAITPTVTAGRWRSDAMESTKGTIVPSVTSQRNERPDGHV